MFNWDNNVFVCIQILIILQGLWSYIFEIYVELCGCYIEYFYKIIRITLNMLFILL